MHVGLLAIGARPAQRADCGCGGDCGPCSANGGRGARQLQDLVVRESLDKQLYFDRRRLRVWFATNYPKKSEACHTGDSRGCNLYEATVLLPLIRQARLKVIDGPHLVDGARPGTGAWFPSVTRQGEDVLLAWNRTTTGGGTIEQRNEMAVQVVRPDGTVPVDIAVAGARFPHWDRKGTGDMVYTRYNANRATVVNASGDIAEDAEDGSFVGTGSCVAYQEQKTAGNPWKGPLASCRPDSPDYTPTCGHASSPLRGRTVICSEAGVGLKQIRVADIGTNEPPSDFMAVAAEGKLPGQVCDDASEAYTSWGDRSDLFVVTVLCRNGPAVTGSRIYLVRHRAAGIVAADEVLDLSAALEGAFGVAQIQFCTADFVAG